MDTQRQIDTRTYTTKHSTGLLAHRSTILLSLRIKHAHLLTQTDMQSHTHSPAHTSLPRHSHTCTRHRVVWSTDDSYTSTIPMDRHIVTDCTRSVTHIYPLSGPDASKPQARSSPLHNKYFFRKVYTIPQSPPLPNLTTRSFGSQTFPSPSSSLSPEDLPPATHPSFNVPPHLHTQKPDSRPHCPPPIQAVG